LGRIARHLGALDGRLVEELEDALRARHCRLEDRVALREEAHGLEELPDVLRERDDEGERDRRIGDTSQPRPP
jgi:hypothetical protein